MKSGDPRRRYQGTLRLSHNAWLIGFKQLRLGPQMRREKVADIADLAFQYASGPS
jgi:hypothetical protein